MEESNKTTGAVAYRAKHSLSVLGNVGMRFDSSVHSSWYNRACAAPSNVCDSLVSSSAGGNTCTATDGMVVDVADFVALVLALFVREISVVFVSTVPSCPPSSAAVFQNLQKTVKSCNGAIREDARLVRNRYKRITTSVSSVQPVSLLCKNPR